jgi:ABC-type glycerol-3-phosphate transport system substrate-binding protein
VWNGDLYFAYEIWLPMSIIARKDLLEEAEVDPASIKTHDDYLAALQAVATKTDMAQPLAYMLGESYAAMDHSLHWFNSNSLNSMADFTNRDAWIDTVQFIQELFPYVPEAALGWAYPEAERAYATGAIGSLVHGSWLIASREFDTAGIFTPERSLPLATPFGPYAAEESPFYAPAENGYFLGSQSQHPQAAIDFICVATATQILLATRGTDLPATDDWDAESLLAARPDQEDIVWWYDHWREIGQTDRAVAAPGMVARTELEQRWYELLIDLWNGNTTPEQMYDDFEGFAVPIIEEVTETT